MSAFLTVDGVSKRFRGLVAVEDGLARQVKIADTQGRCGVWGGWVGHRSLFRSRELVSYLHLIM